MYKNAPAWFQTAVENPRSSHLLDVEGCDIHYQAWGEPKKPGLLLVHGNGAHARWWDFIAPFFTEHYYVVAYDLSGMGDSGHRDCYTPESYGRELAGVVESVGFSGKPLVIGHSFGARIAFKALQLFPGLFAGLILADSPFHPPDQRFDFHKRRQKPVKPHRRYASLAEAKERFRLFPEQPCENDYIVDYIAEYSIRETDEGWCWKFDPKIYSQFDYEGLLTVQPCATDKVLGMVYGEYSALYNEQTLRYNEELFASLGFPKLIRLPGAHHHLLLDKPLEFVKVVNDILRLNEVDRRFKSSPHNGSVAPAGD